MTQENDAAGRAQNVNESFDATTDVADESFAQDWLNAEETENVEASAAPRSSIVATLPDWTTFSNGNVERRERRAWREILRSGALRTSGVALAAFGLGVFCATDRRSDDSAPNDVEFVATEIETGSEKTTAFGIAADETTFDALTAIDSSTLRSVPNARGADFIAPPNAEKNSASSADWGNGAALAGNVGFADSNGWENGGGDLVGATAPANAAANSNGSDDSSWRRGVDFQRDSANSVNSANLTADVERFPTWDELETNASAPTFEETPNVANGIASSDAPNGANPANVGWSAGTVPVANNRYPGGNLSSTRDSNVVAAPNVENGVDYIAYGDNIAYQSPNAANLTGGAPQFAGNSQNSGYNQIDGSENFAGWPTTSAPVAAPNWGTSAPVASSNIGTTAPVASSNIGTGAPVASSSFGTTAPGASSNFGTTAPVASSSFGTTAPVASSNIGTTAPGASSSFGTSAPVSVPNFGTTAPVASSNLGTGAPVAEPPRAMVAQVPNENPAAATPNVPVANPNLRW